MKKLILLILAFVAIATGASAATDYGFSVFHVDINSDNYQSQSAGKAWYYDPATNVLHLTDGELTYPIFLSHTIEINGDVNPTLTIQVDGNCKFGGEYSSGLRFTGNGQHTICGNGTLTMKPDKLDPQVINSVGKTILTIKDVTINIEAWGEMAIGIYNAGFSEINLYNCEMNIKTSYAAWYGKPNASGTKPYYEDCYLVDESSGYVGIDGIFYNNDGTPRKEVNIKRSLRVFNVTVDEPVVGNVTSTNCTPSSTDYYALQVEWWWIYNGTKVGLEEGKDVFNAFEQYAVSVLLKPSDGIKFADNEERMTVYINGKEATIERGRYDYVYATYTFPELGTRYDLWVGGKQVTDVNMDDIFGDGKVRYNTSTKTLSLKNGTSIHGQGSANDATTGYGAGIYSEIDGLTIDVASGGAEVIGADECHGIYLRGNTTIKGESSIVCKGYIGVFMGSNSADLTVDGKVALQAEGTTSNGLGGYVRGFAGNINYYTTLTIKGSAMVLAKGELGSVRNWKDLVLNNHAITSPAGAVWNADKHAVCDASGNPIAGEWVSIIKVANPYDLNGDEKVSTADIQVIINEMKKPQASQDMKYDLNNDGKISTADIQVIINEMKK
ncbi:MAG: hypothetical protein IJL45_07305 [Prevotella sp.]|nr:hypothetical protein [Prevotella sp.]